MNTTLSDLFTILRSESRNEALKGRRFERLMKAALEKHPGEYGPARFEQVWMWSEWPERAERGFLGQDTGIDLVARQTEAQGGGLCAIQCKFYADTRSVPTREINSFLASSDTDDFRSRILIATGEITGPAWTKIKKARPRCQVISGPDLNKWPVRWADFLNDPDALAFDPVRYEPHPFQAEAVEKIRQGFETTDRGKLILPCGTGKSVVSLWAAEQIVGVGGKVLYLVPSIALMGQTMREWARQRNPHIPHRYIGICSDTRTGRANEDSDLTELAMPVSTDPERIRQQLSLRHDREMTVVFCTYQSLPLVGQAQASVDKANFDLVICDEAHRTTGVDSISNRGNGTTSGFRLIHNEQKIAARRRLFMTATPRIYTTKARSQVARAAGEYGVYSMDDDHLYGPEFYRMDFADAVEAGHLTDYKVVVIAVDEKLAAGLHDQIPVEDGRPLRIDDVVKLAGCWDALADPTTKTTAARITGAVNPEHAAKRAIAFTNTIATSKKVAQYWVPVIGTAAAHSPGTTLLDCSVRHVDGKMNAYERARLIDWLQQGGEDGRCRVVTNAKVLTEGVNIPALDAILFIQPKKSQVDVVQAVGRVMRRSEGKETGYVVIPVIVPEGAGLGDDAFLNGSDFKQVWSVLKALRSHDGRADVWINTADLGAATPLVIYPLGDICPMCGERGCDESDSCPALGEGFIQGRFLFAWQNAVASKLVEKCGDRQYWDRWAERVNEIANRIRGRLERSIEVDPELQDAFGRFLADMRNTVGEHITEEDLTRMVSHHVVTLPVFDALFSESGFASRNPVSKALNELLSEFNARRHHLEDETGELERFYQSVARRVEAAANSEARLRVMLDVYESFFKKAMPREVRQLGIAYTPVEIVDFMLRSVDAVCRREFGRGMTAENVHILDPFTGTGTFINRLLTQRSGDGEYLIRDEDLDRKFTGVGAAGGVPEIHANEILLLAYYLAAVKIEEGYNERRGNYEPFEGIVLTDTFEMDADDSRLAGTTPLRGNTERTRRQNRLPIQVILGNPPWSAGQKSAGDDNPNITYDIAERVRGTYGRKHKEVTGRAAGGSAAGNLYVEAFRCASDRLNLPGGSKQPGVLAFVHPNSLATGTSLAGMRAALRDEFTTIYVVNLRGDAYKSGEEFRREGDKLFGGGSRNAVQITVLVRNPDKDLNTPAMLRYAEVPEYSSLDDKFAWLERLGDVTGDQFETVPVNDRHDWVNLTDGTFEQLLPVCSARSNADAVAHSHASGVKTNCDTYVYSFSRDALINRITDLINEYEYARHQVETGVLTAEEATRNTDLKVIKWTDTLKQSLKRDKKIVFDESRIREVLYRPFTKLWLYEDDRILSSVKTISKMFPLDDKRPPPPRPSSSPPRTTGRLSEHLPQTTFPTSAPQEPTNPVESYLGGDPDNERSATSVRGADHEDAPRPSCDGPSDAKHPAPYGNTSITPPPPEVGSARQPHPATPLRNHRYGRALRPLRHGKADPSCTAATVTMAGPSNMALFGVLATSLIPDLHTMGPGQQTRVITRLQPS